jgi:branched-subunit amino acid transport protein
MNEKRILGLLALLIGLIGGLLILSRELIDDSIDLGQSLESFLDTLVFLILGLAILLGSVLIYRRNYGSGGIVNILLGIVAFLLRADTTGAILAIVSGVMGLVAIERRRPAY